jgi:hypothetical protein
MHAKIRMKYCGAFTCSAWPGHDDLGHRSGCNVPVTNSPALMPPRLSSPVSIPMASKQKSREPIAARQPNITLFVAPSVSLQRETSGRIRACQLGLVPFRSSLLLLRRSRCFSSDSFGMRRGKRGWAWTNPDSRNMYVDGVEKPDDGCFQILPDSDSLPNPGSSIAGKNPSTTSPT